MLNHPMGTSVAPGLRSEVTNDRVLELTLDRARARNALDLETLTGLTRVFEEAGSNPQLSVIVLAGEGPVFSAGHDLKELTAHRNDADHGAGFFEATMAACSRAMQAIVNCPLPVIAAVEGMATAAGCQLVATCDLAIAGGRARFQTPGVDIGLFCSTPLVALTRNMAAKRAMEMLLTAEPLDAVAALEHGLVNRVVAEGQALTAARAMARTIAAKPRAVVARGKQVFQAQRHLSIEAAYDLACRAMVENLLEADAVEGIDAFLTKRVPRWKDR